MTGVDLVVAVAGVCVTVLVVAGMILLTPRGLEPAGDAPDRQDAPAGPVRARDGEPVEVPTVR